MKHQGKDYAVKRNPNGGLMLTYIPGGPASMKTVIQLEYYGVRKRLSQYENLYTSFYGTTDTFLANTPGGATNTARKETETTRV